MKREPIGTVVVGSNALLREGLARILNAAGFRVLVSASAINDSVLNSLPREQSILLIIDVSDHFDAALGQIESLRKRYPAGRVVMLTQQQQIPEMVSAFRMGANAYLVKVATSDIFIKSLELVMLGMTLFPLEGLTFISGRQDRSRNGAAGHAVHAARDENEHGRDDGETVGASIGTNENEHTGQAGTSYTRLSARQQSILGCLIEGDSNKTIARKMAIAEATVKVHVKAILRRIQVHNRTQAAIWAMSAGPSVSKEDASPVLGKLPAEPFGSLDVAQVVSAGHEHQSTLLRALKIGGANQVAVPNIVRLVRNSIRKKND
jgi:two-component system nitrate/nitrite response regulator NarL